MLTSFGVIRLVRFTINEMKLHNLLRSIQHATDAKASLSPQFTCRKRFLGGGCYCFSVEAENNKPH